MSNREKLHETALKAPSSSGVYLWRNHQGDVIYVGKAKNLKNRLTSYFAKNKDIKTRLLVKSASSIEYITTSNEYEAFLLENNLIKKYTPRYNINLKDGKSYPVLRITKEDFPRLFKTRNVLHDGSSYFGPYPDSGALDSFIETLYEIYPLRHCKSFKKRTSPCLYYHMGQCQAPCVSKITKEAYNEYFGEITDLLEGKGQETLDKIRAKMKEASKVLNFEKAKRLRDGINALMIMQNQNVVENFDREDRDYIAYHRNGELVSFTILKIRGGKLLGRDNFRVTSLHEDEELTEEFISSYYTSKEEVPPRIYTPTVEGKDLLIRYLKETLETDTEIILVNDDIEQASLHKASMNMAFQNAKEDIVRRMRERGDTPALEELKKVLNLPSLPVRIEGFDIAHIGGKFPVASLISFYNGNPDKKNYRYFRLRTTDGYIDDFQSMREATTRRYTRLINEQQDLPDLILIDGGIGQVNAVDEVLKTLDLDIPILGLAKRDEEIWKPYAKEPIKLSKRSDALRLLQRVRDETHRFATSRNQTLRTKENTVQAFSHIKGIGPKREKIILEKYSTSENLSKADPCELMNLLNITKNQAIEILQEAMALNNKREEIKEIQRLSLGEAGTTKEIASQNQYLKDLVDEAIDETDE